MSGFNYQRNGYRMACKPPLCRLLGPPNSFPAPSRVPRCPDWRGRVTAVPGRSWLVAAALSARPACAGHCRRNAVGRVGVKLGAAPDAPHWGEVLVRTPSDRFLGARRRAASNITCLSREHPACPADTTSVGGDVRASAEPRLRWPASSGGGGRRGRKSSWPSAGLRIAGNPAWTSARPTWRQLSPVQRDSGQYTTVPAAVTRTPGRTPSERNDGLVLG